MPEILIRHVDAWTGERLQVQAEPHGRAPEEQERSTHEKPACRESVNEMPREDREGRPERGGSMVDVRGLIWALLALGLFGGCSEPGPPASDAGNAAEPAETEQAVRRPHPEFVGYVNAYNSAVEYYNSHGTWLNMATEEQDDRTEPRLAEALEGMEELAREGRLFETELALLRQEVEDIDRWGGRRSRTVERRDGAWVHSDGVRPLVGSYTYRELRARLPLLRALLDQSEWNRPVVSWLQEKVRGRIEVLSDPNAAKNGEQTARILLMLGDATEDPDVAALAPYMTASALRETAQGLVERIDDLAQPGSSATRPTPSSPAARRGSSSPGGGGG